MRIDPPAPASSMASGRGSKTGSSTPTPCCSKVGMKRGPWTPEEDEILASYIRREGEGRWRTLPKRAGLLRCGKSCRLRWMNYLRPNVKRGQIAPDEEDLILRLHRLLGNRWSLIAGRIPGRTDNEIKNYWNTHLSKKLISQGIDPRTHKPLNPNLVSSGTLPAAPAPEPSPRPPSIGGAAEASRIGPGGEKTYLGHDIRRHEGLDGFHIAADTNQRRGAVANENRHNSEELAKVMGLEGSHENRNEEDGLDYCTDDIFSSFLNSLINEDTLMQQPQNGLFAPSDPSCVMIPTPSFGYGGIRDSSMKAAAPVNEDDKS